MRFDIDLLLTKLLDFFFQLRFLKIKAGYLCYELIGLRTCLVGIVHQLLDFLGQLIPERSLCVLNDLLGF